MCSTVHRKAYIITLLVARAQHFAAIPCCEHFKTPPLDKLDGDRQSDRETDRQYNILLLLCYHLVATSKRERCRLPPTSPCRTREASSAASLAAPFVPAAATRLPRRVAARRRQSGTTSYLDHPPTSVNGHQSQIKSLTFNIIPVVPHKAAAEVSKIGHYRRGELLSCMDGRANPLMDRKVAGVVFFGVVAMVAVVTSPTTAGISVV